MDKPRPARGDPSTPENSASPGETVLGEESDLETITGITWCIQAELKDQEVRAFTNGECALCYPCATSRATAQGVR